MLLKSPWIVSLALLTIVFAWMVFEALTLESGLEFIKLLISSWWGLVTLSDLYIGFFLTSLLVRKLYNLGWFTTIVLFLVTCILGNLFLAWTIAFFAFKQRAIAA